MIIVLRAVAVLFWIAILEQPSNSAHMIGLLFVTAVLYA